MDGWTDGRREGEGLRGRWKSICFFAVQCECEAVIDGGWLVCWCEGDVQGE